MRAVVTPGEMGAADRATIASGTPSLQLMERAGWALARETQRVAGGAYGRRVLVLAGKGNNAGDALVAARLLAGWGGYPVVVFVDDPDLLRGDAAINRSRLRGVPQATYQEESFNRELQRCDVVIDGIVGTGFRGSLAGPAAQIVEAVNASGRPVVAADIPSGVDGATGSVAGPAILATVTVTMGAAKLGLILYPGSVHAGHVVVAGIGITTPQPPEVCGLPGAAEAARFLGHRPPNAHKKSVGTVMVVAGSARMPGAAYLSCQAALRAGAGLVTLASTSAVAGRVHPAVFEALALHLPATEAGSLSGAALEPILEQAQSVDAVAIGPGLGTDTETADLVRQLAAALELPLVVDADGLNALASGPAGPGLLAGRCAPTILTPHPGEASRLLGVTNAQIQADRLGSARRLAAGFKATVILKGYRSVVAEPCGATMVITTGGPALAKGGSGDVLTGVVAALLAGTTHAAPGTSRDAFAAAWAAAWIHGRAGDHLAERLGVRGALAGDLPDAVAEVLHELEDLA